MTLAHGQNATQSMTEQPAIAEVQSRELGTDHGDDQVKYEVGDQAPAIEIEEWLPRSGVAAAPDVSQKRIVVIEFWATWCAPCIQGIPHLNELANAMGERAIFIAVSSEVDLATVAEFLERKAHV
jgi:thiol-disulfide isomerase/thioredoxin